MAIQPGCVVEVFAAHITPPKRKYFVVCCLDPPLLGFFINSEIREYVARRPRLRAAQVSLLKAEHAFLRHDSWLDCSDVHTFTIEFLEREVRTNPPALLGQLSVNALAAMLVAVVNGYTLAGDHIRRICAALGSNEQRSPRGSAPAHPGD
jgi:hypothetical protein